MPPEDTGSLDEFAQNEALKELAGQIVESTPVVSDSVLSKRFTLAEAVLRQTSDADVTEAFGALRHFALELRVALTESEAYLTTLLLPTPVVAMLLGEEIDADALSEESAAPIIERLTTSGREYVDLLTLMLFTDSAVHGEITVSEARLDAIEESVGMVLDTAGGAPLYRLDCDVVVGEEERGAITLLLPESLMTGLARGLSGAAAAAAPAPAAAAEQPAGAKEAADEAMGAPATGLDDLGDLGDVEGDGEEAIPVTPLQFPDLPSRDVPLAAPQPLDLILDVTMRVSVELGRAKMSVQEILALGPGSVVELDKLAGEPVDILVNDRFIARGEVVMVDENFGVRVTEILVLGAGSKTMDRAA